MGQLSNKDSNKIVWRQKWLFGVFWRGWMSQLPLKLWDCWGSESGKATHRNCWITAACKGLISVSVSALLLMACVQNWYCRFFQTEFMLLSFVHGKNNALILPRPVCTVSNSLIILNPNHELMLPLEYLASWMYQPAPVFSLCSFFFLCLDSVHFTILEFKLSFNCFEAL